MKRLLLMMMAASIALTSLAKIDLTADLENYVFTGVNTANNYRYVLSPYEMGNNGPQFQLVVNPIDPTMPAQFTADDLKDNNYWEPMFKYYTAQLAGQEMLAQNNIKRLYLGDVQLLPGQFIDYDNLHIIGFDLTKDYSLPENCLRNAGSHLDAINVNSAATMTLGANSIPADKVFEVNVNSTSLQQVWASYKQQYGCQYNINLLAGVGIFSVKVAANMGHGVEEMALPESGMPEVDMTDGGSYGESKFVMDGFVATTSSEITSVKLVVSIREYGTAATQWENVDAAQTAAGQWGVSGLNIDLLEGVEKDKPYLLELYFEAADGNGQKYYYNNGGANYKIKYMKGDGEQQPVTFYDEETAGVGLIVNGTLINFTLNGNGTKSPDGHLGNVNSLLLNGFWVRCLRQSGVELEDVSLQWRLIDSDAEVVTGWNRVNFQYQRDEEGDKFKKYFEANDLFIDLIEQCNEGADYRLEVMYQLINSRDGHYYMFGKDEEVGRFYFTVGATSPRGDVNGDGRVDISDINASINMMLGKIPKTPAGDVDQNGSVDISDVNAVINIMLGK